MNFRWIEEYFFGTGVTRQPPEKIDIRSDPLVGEYQTKGGEWWAEVLLAGLTYTVKLRAPGVQPTIEQLGSFEALVHRLPTLIELSQLEDAPADDGWGVPPPPYSIDSSPVSSIWMDVNEGFYVILKIDPTGRYMLAPAFEISSNLVLKSAEWIV